MEINIDPFLGSCHAKPYADESPLPTGGYLRWICAFSCRMRK
jgi:hypothetical protein